MKKAWPRAITQVSILNKFSHLGTNRYLTPSKDPGKVRDLMIKIIKIKRSSGITILFNFSIPRSIPKETIIKVNIIARANQKIVLGVPAKLLK